MILNVVRDPVVSLKSRLGHVKDKRSGTYDVQGLAIASLLYVSEE